MLLLWRLFAVLRLPGLLLAGLLLAGLPGLTGLLVRTGRSRADCWPLWLCWNLAGRRLCCCMPWMLLLQLLGLLHQLFLLITLLGRVLRRARLLGQLLLALGELIQLGHGIVDLASAVPRPKRSRPAAHTGSSRCPARDRTGWPDRGRRCRRHRRRRHRRAAEGDLNIALRGLRRAPGAAARFPRAQIASFHPCLFSLSDAVPMSAPAAFISSMTVLNSAATDSSSSRLFMRCAKDSACALSVGFGGRTGTRRSPWFWSCHWDGWRYRWP